MIGEVHGGRNGKARVGERQKEPRQGMRRQDMLAATKQRCSNLRCVVNTSMGGCRHANGALRFRGG